MRSMRPDSARGDRSRRAYRAACGPAPRRTLCGRPCTIRAPTRPGFSSQGIGRRPQAARWQIWWRARAASCARSFFPPMLAVPRREFSDCRYRSGLHRHQRGKCGAYDHAAAHPHRHGGHREARSLRSSTRSFSCGCWCARRPGAISRSIPCSIAARSGERPCRRAGGISHCARR